MSSAYLFQVVTGDLFVAIGILSATYGFMQQDKIKVNLGVLLSLIGVIILYQAVIRKLGSEHRVYQIINGLYMGLGLIFALASLWSEDDIIIRTMSTSVFTTATIALNVVYFDKNI